MQFQLQASFKPTGDQPEAIEKLTKNLESGVKDQVLLGVTGSGKTFTVANVIQNIQKPTLVIAHNKTLAAQLYSEFREFFPNNAVHYFVSYYDYYQPEAYIPRTDTYIEKEVDINDEIDRLRLATTSALLTRSDVITVASVSCIYGLGSPKIYRQSSFTLKVGQSINHYELFRKLADIQYQRNDLDFRRGRFRVKGDIIDIFPAYDEEAYRLEFFGNEIEKIFRIHPLTNQKIDTIDNILLFPAKHYITPFQQEEVLKAIENDLETEVKQLESQAKLSEAHRLKQKTTFDLEMIRNTGYTNGIENYSRYFDGRAPGSPPFTLIDFFEDQGEFLIVVDESHMTIPQIRGMYNGDQARKQTLIDYGFRLKAARDNRPLKFTEFDEKRQNTIYVSATPCPWELEKSHNTVIEQLIRPTGILDPEIEVLPTNGQIENLMQEIQDRVKKSQRVIITTLTKKMSEDLSEFLLDKGIKVHHLHSEIQTFERSEILRSLRLGEYDVIVGINLLREGLDLPEVTLVIILDADKEGFLRSETSLIQTVGRAARHTEGKVIMYADKVTQSMSKTITETNRRRRIQKKYNFIHNITPQTIIKDIKELKLNLSKKDEKDQLAILKKLSAQQKAVVIEELREEMRVAAENLNFEHAAVLRDQIKEIKS